MITKLEIEITDPNKGSIYRLVYEGTHSDLPRTRDSFLATVEKLCQSKKELTSYTQTVQ